MALGFNIDHIFPQVVDASWEAFSERDHETCVDRLGIQMLLDTKSIQSLANSCDFSQLPVLIASAITSTRRLSEPFDSWTLETLAARQARCPELPPASGA